MTIDHENCPSSELDLAQQIQQLLFPKSSPVCTWCCIGQKNLMADELGGDYYDFITMPDGCQTLLIGDVTGHGVHASIVMALIYGFIHRASRGECSPVELVRQVNDFLNSFAERSNALDYYFSSTLFFAIIDPQNMDMVYVNAGHVPPLVQRNGTIRELRPTAQPIGFFEKFEVALGRFQFVQGDRLLLYTDGIIEGTNGAGEPFGSERLKAALKNSSDDYLEFLDDLFAELNDFGVNDPPTDDCTAIVVDFHDGFAAA
jgi:sigma-B regulation protein RsbU (phosphoserine phosphatase)